jgi:hypothetical protein
MRRWNSILPSLLLAACADGGFDALVVSGPREGAFFSCGCGPDREGGMSAALARASGRVLWVETGDPFGAERAFVGRFLAERPAGFRVEGLSGDAEKLRFRDGTEALLLFVDRLDCGALRRHARGALPLLCVASAFSGRVFEAISGARGLYLVGDRPREGGSPTMRVAGRVGRGGRSVAIVSAGLSVRVERALPSPGAPTDPLDLEWLSARHAAARLPPPAAGERRSDPGSCAACHPATVRRWRESAHARAARSLPAGAGLHCRACHGGGRPEGVACDACHPGTGNHPPDAAPPAGDCRGCHTESSSPRFDRERYGARVRCGG